MYTINQMHTLLTKNGVVKNKVSDHFGKLNTPYKKNLDAFTKEINTEVANNAAATVNTVKATCDTTNTTGVWSFTKPTVSDKHKQCEVTNIHLHKEYDLYYVAVLGLGVAVGCLVFIAIKAGYML